MLERLKQSHFWRYQGPMIAWALALFTQSSIPGDRIPDIGFLTHDKVIHFLIYVVFAIVVNRGIRNQQKFPLLAQYHYLFTILVVSLYGASDELHQYFVPNRSCSLYDWFADSLGGAAVVLLDWAKTRFRPGTVS